MHPLAESPASTSRARRRATVGAVIATLGLLGLAVISFPLGNLFLVGGLLCDPERGGDALICTDPGQRLVVALPVVGAAAGLVSAVVGWAWPRRRRWVWLTIGYAIAFGAVCASVVIAVGTSH